MLTKEFNVMSIVKTSTEPVTTKKVEGIEHQKLKEKLLISLNNSGFLPSGGTSTESALYEIRLREFNRLIADEK